MGKRCGGAGSALLTLVILLAFFAALLELETGQGEESRLRLEESIRRAAVTCYAVEGIYPPNLAYLQTHYGLQVDETRYDVFYEVFASNGMPEITVVERNA